MNIERCELCGTLLFLLGREGELDRWHEPSGQSCKVFAWNKESHDRGLHRVSGETAVEAETLGIPYVYGPVFHQDEKTNARKFVSGVFIERWGLYLLEAIGHNFVKLGENTVSMIVSRLRNDEAFRAAFLSVGDMCEAPGMRRAAVVQFLRGESVSTQRWVAEESDRE